MAVSVGEVIARQVARYRRQQGLSQQEVADRTKAIGHPLSRVTVAKIESDPGGRAANLSVADWLALAFALDVPPPLLVIPLGIEEEYAVTPELVAHPHLVLDWLAGEEPLAALPDNFVVSNMKAWHRNALWLQLYRGLRERQNAVTAATTEDELDRAKAALTAWCEAMRAGGVPVPKDVG